MSTAIKIPTPPHRNAVVVAMMARRQSGGPHRNRQAKRAAQKARKAEAGAY
jgi:hypothetical protein